MSIVNHRAPWPADGWIPDALLAIGAMEDLAHEVRCAARHLAVAASQMARGGSLSRAAAIRYTSAEAWFRSQAANYEGLRGRPTPSGPVLRLADGATVSLTILFAGVCHRDRWWVPNRSIDPDLVHAAKELLCGLRWFLPDEGTLPDN
jgi:hypothetical protein